MSATAQPLPGLVRAYAGLVTEAIAQTLGKNLMGVVTTGSLALDDFTPERSDIDLIAVCRRPLSPAERRDLPARIDDEVLPCPATGLDLIVFTRQQVSCLPRPMSFELAVTTGARWGLDVVSAAMDEEMLLDLEIARRHGRALHGPEPVALLKEVPAERLRVALLVALTWQRDHLFNPRHDPRGTEGVLAACRALHWLDNGNLVAKTVAGRRLAQAPGYGPLAGAALARRTGRMRTALRGREVRELLADVIPKLEAK
ncbi:MAG: hypothetical protein O7F11_08310 [Acidobacteria bacterium]|nr:hypothetical protein [Acidobacteriota bacterium]MCZ6833735.1 hypothetical protein [Acidobacteriota bacterium]